MKNAVIAIAATATIAAASVSLFAAPAEAKGGGGHFHHHFRPVFIPSYSPPAEEYTYRRKVIIIKQSPARSTAESAPTVKLTDGKGRIYDPASKTWFDGKSQCWSGQQAFAFKGGSWFYGKTPWRQANGTWQTAAEDAPAPVACDGVAAFAAKVQPASEVTSQPIRTQGVEKTAKSEPAKPVIKAAETVKTAENAGSAKVGESPKQTECKKYFPSVGEMLTVPCGE